MLKGTIRAMQYKSVVLEEPDMLKCTTESGDIEILMMGKDAITFIYSLMGIPFNASKKLFEKSRELWENLKLECTIANDQFKGFHNYTYLVYQDNVAMAVFDLPVEDVIYECELFDAGLETATTQYTINRDGVIKLMCKTKQESDGCYSVFLMDINPTKGIYTAYNGILTPEYLIVLSNPICHTKSFYEFMTTVDVENEIKMSDKMFGNIYTIFADEVETSNTKASLREVIDLLKKSKCEVTLDGKKKLASLSLVGSENLVKMINSYNMEYKPLIKQETLKNSLTYGDVKILEILEILTKNYMLGNNSICADTVANFLKPYYTNRTDRIITEECLPIK